MPSEPPRTPPRSRPPAPPTPPPARPPPPPPARPQPPGPAAQFAALSGWSIALGGEVRQALRGLVPLLIGASAIGVAGVGLAVIGLGLLLAYQVAAWQRFRWRFDGAVLTIRSGVFSRTRREFDVARIQQVEIDRSLVHRIVGVATVRVETASAGREAEVELRVLADDVATALATALRAGRAGTGPADSAIEAADEPVLTVPTGDVVLGAVTGAQLLVLPGILAGLVGFAGEFLGTEDIGDVARRVIDLGGLGLLLVALPAAFVVAAAAAVLRDGQFRVTYRDGDLRVVRGLLTTREVVVPVRRVQLVVVRSNPVRRRLGAATVQIRSAGGPAQGDRRVQVPLVRSAELDRFLATVLDHPGGLPEPARHPQAARRRALVRRLVPAALVAVAAAIALDDPWRPLGLLLLPVAVWLAWRDHAWLGSALDGHVVAGRDGALLVSTRLAPVRRIQAVARRASPFQRRLGLASVVATVPGTGAAVPIRDVGADRAGTLHTTLTHHAAGRHG